MKNTPYQINLNKDTKRARGFIRAFNRAFWEQTYRLEDVYNEPSENKRDAYTACMHHFSEEWPNNSGARIISWNCQRFTFAYLHFKKVENYHVVIPQSDVTLVIITAEHEYHIEGLTTSRPYLVDIDELQKTAHQRMDKKGTNK